MILADVYINIPIKSISRAYSYIIPDELAFLDVGWRVIVPFGGRDIEGFVVSKKIASPDLPKNYQLKAVKGTLDDEPWFTKEVIEASTWIADFYLCSVGEIMRLFIPGKSGAHIQLQYEAVPDMRDHVLLSVGLYRELYDTIAESGPISKKALQERLMAAGKAEQAGSLPEALAKLLDYNVVKRVYNVDTKAKAAYENIFIPVVNITDELLNNYSRKPAQKRLLEYMKAFESASNMSKRGFRLTQLKEAGFSNAVIKALTEDGIIQKGRERLYRNSYSGAVKPAAEIELTEAQQQAVKGITLAVREKNNQEFLLYGVTGSGKTQVYIESAKITRGLGRRVVVLVPEIALTGQVVEAFKSNFSDDIIVIHSRLSVSERNDAILRVRRGEAGIIIGARSALFTPADNIGLIILDEEQDNSYKQDESPRYHARVVAEKLGEVYNAPVVLGSATPSLETYYRTKTGECRILMLPGRIGNKPLPQVSCVDMRQELKQGRRNIISQALRQLIEETIQKGEQMILMLNRRGFSTFVMCRSCGEVIRCPQCNMPLVYHQNKSLMCHHCDIKLPVPDVCPKCESRYIKYFGSGTERLEQELKKLVPMARVIRMDRDTTKGKFSHGEIIKQFKKREFDILLGTQMVAKGHDIPNVTGVGIISADSALNMPDFRAAERVFMLITQTAGRAGRGDIPGKVIVQSYSPESPAVQWGIRQNYEAFYREELQLRRELFFPPFCRIIKLIFHNEQSEAAKEQAELFKKNFLDYFGENKHQQIIGPAPALIYSYRGIYRFSMLIKTADIWAVNKFLRAQGLHENMHVVIDIDPLTTS
ncbi:primosomal protein N' [uncultured Anaerovibrio sp.]|uniref:replication restart helicase PriA n=1 Tax=uncultured Anaerovibrio sp. TaxID=361586 RepID=UPI00261AFDCB|nr:primosomal protein N' [uncultured Anaerovibrio sp.]